MPVILTREYCGKLAPCVHRFPTDFQCFDFSDILIRKCNNSLRLGCEARQPPRLGGAGVWRACSRECRGDFPVVWGKCHEVTKGRSLLRCRGMSHSDKGKQPPSRPRGRTTAVLGRRWGLGRFPHGVGEMSRSDKGGRPACGVLPSGDARGREPLASAA